MRRRFLAFLLTMPVLMACGRTPKLASLPIGSKVLAFGDSVTFGTGAAPGADYPSRLAALSGWSVHNRGVPGDTAEAAKSRIGDALEEVQPAMVIIEIGGNDFLRRRAEAEVKEDIRAILRQVKHARVPVVLVATPRFSLVGAAMGSLPDAALYAELAKEEGVPLVPDIFAEVLSDPTLKADAVHPNAEGYRKLAEGIAERLSALGLLARR